MYNSSLPTAASYTVPSPSDAPESLQFGDKFIDLASEYERSVTLGTLIQNAIYTSNACQYQASTAA